MPGEPLLVTSTQSRVIGIGREIKNVISQHALMHQHKKNPHKAQPGQLGCFSGCFIHVSMVKFSRPQSSGSPANAQGLAPADLIKSALQLAAGMKNYSGRQNCYLVRTWGHSNEL